MALRMRARAAGGSLVAGPRLGRPLMRCGRLHGGLFRKGRPAQAREGHGRLGRDRIGCLRGDVFEDNPLRALREAPLPAMSALGLGPRWLLLTSWLSLSFPPESGQARCPGLEVVLGPGVPKPPPREVTAAAPGLATPAPSLSLRRENEICKAHAAWCCQSLE